MLDLPTPSDRRAFAPKAHTRLLTTWLLCVALVALLLQALPAAAQSSGRRIALVIGNDSYRQVPVLRNAREDARAMAEALGKAQYQVRLELDLDRAGLLAALRGFRSSVNGGDEVVVFFAGHGVQIGAENFLLPVDARGESEDEVRDEAVPLQRLLDDIAERRPRLSMTIVDACRNNPFRSAGRSVGGARGLAATTAATGQVVIYSAGAGQQALDRLNDRDPSRNGLFTRVFVEEMLTPDLPIDRVVRNVRQRVSELAKTVGHNQVPAIYDQVSGDFFFTTSAAARGFALAAPQAPARLSAPTAPSPAPAPAARGEDTAFELAFWNSISDSRDPAELQAYLNRFPKGQFAELARARMRPKAADAVVAAAAPSVAAAPVAPLAQAAPAPVAAAAPPATARPVVVAAAVPSPAPVKPVPPAPVAAPAVPATPPAPVAPAVLPPPKVVALAPAAVPAPPAAVLPAGASLWNDRKLTYRFFDPTVRRDLKRDTYAARHDPAQGLRLDGAEPFVLGADGAWKSGTWLPVAVMESVNAGRLVTGQKLRLAGTGAPDSSTLVASINAVEAVTRDFGGGPARLVRVRFFGFGAWSGGSGASHSGELTIDPATGLITALSIRCTEHPNVCAPSPFVVGFELDSVR